MTIRIRFFAILRDAAGISELSVDLPAGTTAHSAAAMLGDRFPALEPHLAKTAFAINQTYRPSSTPLQDGDELALIPPVSGG